MASITYKANGRHVIQFTDGDGTRRTLRPGQCNRKAAAAIKAKVESIVSATIARVSLDDETARWLRDLGDDLHAKLAAVGLVAPRADFTATVGELIDDYLDGRGDLKAGTRVSARADAASLIELLGRDKLLRDVNAGDAAHFSPWLRQRGLAAATVGRRVRRAREFFAVAMRRKLIRENPFDGIKGPVEWNEGRKAFIDRDQTAKLLDACPNAQWRLLVALARYGGLRIPSEALALTWGDVDRAAGTLRVPSPKTEHLPGGEARVIPLFPELRPHLQEAFDVAEPGTLHVVTICRDAAKNLRTHLVRLIRRAGMTPWAKPFHNLRASRETELAERFPLHVVCAWIGNSERIAQRHYLQVTAEHFDAARRTDENGAAKSDARALQKATLSATGGNCRELTTPSELVATARVRPLQAIADMLRQSEPATRHGFEP